MILDVLIDKGIPIPDKFETLRRPMLPFDKMGIGDSVLLAGKDYRNSRRLYECAKKAGVEITVRKQPDGLRVWRTK